MKKSKVTRAVFICAYVVLTIIRFYISFKRGIAESSLINKDNSDLLLIGTLLSACVSLFGTTITYERKGIRKIIISLGILGIIIHIILLLKVAFV